MVGHPTGILFGRGVSRTRTEATSGGGGSPIFVDRFALPNHNMLILASSGAGKSYTAKALTGRSALQGDEVLIVDPDDEYVRLTEALGGEVIREPTQAAKEDSRVVCYALGETEEARLHEARNDPRPRGAPSGCGHGLEALLLRAALVADGDRAPRAGRRDVDRDGNGVPLHDTRRAGDEADALRASVRGAGEDGHAEDGH